MYSGDEHYGDDITSGVDTHDVPVRPDTGPERLARIKADDAKFGFLTADDVEILAGDRNTRLTQCLIRCGRSRFIASAQDVAFLIGVIERHEEEYVRDVSLVGN